MGGDRVTIQTTVVQVVPEKNVILIKGNLYQVIRNLLSLSSQRLKLVNDMGKGGIQSMSGAEKHGKR